ncbi:MAG: EboA domain-containing protein [Planctomycetota bacterium]
MTDVRAIREVLAGLNPGGVTKLEEALRGSAGDPARVSAFSACHRWFGSSPLPASVVAALKNLDREMAWELWPQDGLARLYALLTGLGSDSGYLAKITAHLDLREHEAVARSLGLLPESDTVRNLAREAMRSNAGSVFAALAVGNPYPARHFDNAIFNQMVVKCLFTGTPVKGVVGLEKRLNPELARMLGDYRKELAAAGKALPADLEGLLGAGAVR